MNRLAHASSPYLRQHADNPVEWFEWGDEAFDKARKENKLLIISIGYSSCHWCHVMAHESFMDEACAAYMNAHFVPIKIDREERPDIDKIYMDASQLLSGTGGWPLNIFALPDGRPFFTCTYYPRDEWLDLLKMIKKLQDEKSGEIDGHAALLTTGIRDMVKLHIKTGETGLFSTPDLHRIFSDWQEIIDLEKGGFSKSPKFPMPSSWEFLLIYYYLFREEKALEEVTLTLDRMAAGGIYDQIGGGFARYSVDEDWRIPHFEKMLYDNAQLVSLYSHAFQITKKPRYEEVIRQTLAFIERELTNDEGAFYSSIDADSEGKEGKFYTWKPEEFVEILGNEVGPLLSEYYQIYTPAPDDLPGALAIPISTPQQFSSKKNILPGNMENLLNRSRDKLLKYRNTRVKPGTDTKILTAWNAMMISAYLNAFRALGDPAYYNAALRNAHFLVKNMIDPKGQLYRIFIDGKTTIGGFADDYGYLADAFIHLYELSLDPYWLDLSKQLTDRCLDDFFDPESEMFFYTSRNAEKLIVRTYETDDNVIPSSNSVLAKVLNLLSRFYEGTNYKETATRMATSLRSRILTGGPYYSNWAGLVAMFVSTPVEVAITGKNALAFGRQMQQHFLPTAIFHTGDPQTQGLPGDEKTRIFVCFDGRCDFPVESPEEALILIYKAQSTPEE